MHEGLLASAAVIMIKEGNAALVTIILLSSISSVLSDIFLFVDACMLGLKERKMRNENSIIRPFM